MSSPDLRQLEKQLLKRTKIERRSGPKPVRLSNLIAQTAWLDGQLLWRDGRAVFQVGEKTLQIEDEDVRRTSRALERLEQRDLRRELVDLIANRLQKFGYLREIANIEAPDLRTLCSLSRRHNPKAIERLGALLVVESLVPELLEHSPTRALALAWPLSQSVLESLAKSESYPVQTRELARFALANRHFEFWQVNIDFPVVLCAKLGFAGHELPESLKKIGPYSLSASQIYELYQSGFSSEQVLDIVDVIRNIPSVWPDFFARHPFSPQELLQMRKYYRSLEKSSCDDIRKTLFLLAKTGGNAAIAGSQLLSFWLNHWYELLFKMATKRQKRQNRRGHFVFETTHAVLQKLQTHRSAGEVLAFALEKSQEDSKNLETITATCDYLTEKLNFICDFSAVVGVENARKLGDLSQWTIDQLINEPQWFELMLEWRALSEEQIYFYSELVQAKNRGASLSALRGFSRTIENELRQFSAAVRASVLDSALREYQDRYYLQILAALYKKHAHKFLAFQEDHHYIWGDILSEFSRVASRHKWSEEKAYKLFEIIFEVLKSSFDISKTDNSLSRAAQVVRHIVAVIPIQSEADFQMFRIVLGKAIEWSRRNVTQDLIWDVDRDVVSSIIGRINLRRAFSAAAYRTPRFFFETIPKVTSLKRLHLLDIFDNFEVKTPLQGEQWYRFLARYPQLESEIRECFQWSKLAGSALNAPPISNRWRDYETKTPREMEFLRAKIVEQPQNRGLQKRLATLEAQWQNRDFWLPGELREALLDASSEFARVAIQTAISSALRNRLRVVCGEIPTNLELDNDWINAILLACEVEDNRKWAVTILRHCARVLLEPENANWREKLEGNAKFLGEMRERGKNVDVYAARNERQIGEYTLWIESEPLQILQMGNRFDTCLSRGGINEHSAITNAIDSNKKVVYARQHSNIVGRQLLCVSEDFELLGYHVYSTFQSRSKEKYALNRAFHEYASCFVESVGLEKADKGNVLTLCGASWYDDYEINWAGLLAEPPTEKRGSKSRIVKSNSTRLSAESTHNTSKPTNSLRHTRGHDSSNSGVGFPALASS